MDESVGHKTRNEEKYVERKESVTMRYTLPSVPWSCKGCPVVSWRSWLGDKVNLLPWNCRVTGVSGWEIRFWLPAMLASWAIFTTSPPLTEKKTLTQIALKSIFMVPKQYTELVKGWEKKKRQDMQNQGGLISGTSTAPLCNRRGRKCLRTVLRWDREPETQKWLIKRRGEGGTHKVSKG